MAKHPTRVGDIVARKTLMERRRPILSVLLAAVAALALSRGHADAAGRAPLGSSDVSILVPLKASDRVDDVFKMAGTGLCNALKFDETEPSIFGKDQFDAFAASVFGRGRNGQCNELPLEGPSKGGDAEVLASQPSEHLARRRGLPGRACSYQSWRVVGFRYEPCFERPGRTVQRKEDLVGCTPEARLVAQPWNTEGTPFPDDVALHLIYRVPSPDALVDDLFKLAETTTAATKSVRWDNYDTAADVLRPHPGLRAEMDGCRGPVSTAYRAFLGKHTRSNLLRQVAFMTSSTAQVQWSFGAMAFNGGQFAPIRTASGDVFDNFSGDLFNFGSGSPFNASLRSATFPHTARFFDANLLMSRAELTPLARANAQKASEDLAKIEHPGRVGQGATNCVSCHMVPQTRAELVNKGVVPSTSGAYAKVPFWPAFDQASRGLFNLRNFGYGPGFEMGVSQRTLNETDDVRRSLNAVYLTKP